MSVAAGDLRISRTSDVLNGLVLTADLGIALHIQRNSALDVFLGSDASQDRSKKLCNDTTVSINTINSETLH